MVSPQVHHLAPQEAASEDHQRVRHDPCYGIELPVVIVEKLRLGACYSPCIDSDHKYRDYPHYIDEKCYDGTHDEIGHLLFQRDEHDPEKQDYGY